jgi:hypothetical protein
MKCSLSVIKARDRQKLGIWAAFRPRYGPAPGPKKASTLPSPDPAKSWPSLAQTQAKKVAQRLGQTQRQAQAKSGPGENSDRGYYSCSAKKLVKTKIMPGRKIN